MSAHNATWAQMAAVHGVCYRSFQDWAWRNVEGARGYRSDRHKDDAEKLARIRGGLAKGWALWRVARRANMSVPMCRAFCASHSIALPPPTDARRLTGDARKDALAATRAERMAEIRRQSEAEARAAVKQTMHRNCLRCEGNFLSERADGAWLRLCPHCRSISHIGAGMEGGAGRQVRGKAA